MGLNHPLQAVNYSSRNDELTHCTHILAIKSISIDMINEDSVDDSSGSGGDALDSSGSISIPTEGELLVIPLTI